MEFLVFDDLRKVNDYTFEANSWEDAIEMFREDYNAYIEGEGGEDEFAEAWFDEDCATFYLETLDGAVYSREMIAIEDVEDFPFGVDGLERQ